MLSLTLHAVLTMLQRKHSCHGRHCLSDALPAEQLHVSSSPCTVVNRPSEHGICDSPGAQLLQETAYL